jgi:hypothetical protein
LDVWFDSTLEIQDERGMLIVDLPVVPHKAVAEVSKIGNL